MRPKRTVKALLLAAVFIVTIWTFLPSSGNEDKNIEYNIIEQARKAKDTETGELTNNIPNRHISDAKDTHVFQQKRQVDSNSEIIPLERDHKNLTQHQIEFKNITLSATSEHIKQAMLSINHEQKIHNIDRFPRRPDDGIIIVVMVHDRIEYLEYLIHSLRKADSISSALLIFSHDFYSEDINRVVRSVDFCQMMQIFYPYSLQVYTNEFPGPDAKDCPRDINKERAKETGCNNWEHPDSYGHYREVQFVMTKHHWFWKLQHVFSGQLEATKNHQGLVLLLEEDHYVAPDFYPMLQNMYTLKKSQCPDCDILTLGTYDKTFVYKDRTDKVDVLNWQSSKHNMGMSLDRRTWERIQPCVPEFCSYDDYNWDWSLQFISHRCLKPELQVMLFKSPRVFHIGECGIHHKGKGKCSADDLVKKIESTLVANKDYLFPKNLVLTPMTRPLKTRQPKPNGGWGDVRDHALCLTYGRSTTKGL